MRPAPPDGAVAAPPARSPAPRLPIAIETPCPPQPLPPCPYAFPDPRRAPGDGPLAMGGDFAPGTIVAAYRLGIFPWPHDDCDELWFSPDPRAILPVDGLHVSRRLARRLRRGEFTFSVDRAFAAVLEGCAARDETWITPAYAAGYLALHRLGWAHSIEAWTADGRLAGGLYGIRVGGMFGAESMFHAVTDGSKAALAACAQWAQDEGIALIDVQVITPHTARMGAIEISRDDYLRRLRQALANPAPG